MDTLRLVEVAGDGSLVLMTGDGRRFGLAVDEQVRSAVRRSRNGTHAGTDGTDRPGPREVQARIRAGADAVQVAAQTGLDVDYVRRFEGPVLAERAHVADLARATAVDRGGDPTLDLERVVVEVLTGEGHDVDDIGWDSRKVDGTRWQVVVTSGRGHRTDRTEATWGFDTTTRSLEPVDAEAERLTGVERRRRLSAVRETVFDVERPAPTPAGRGGTVELLDALARQRGRRPVTRPAGPADDGADAVPSVEGPDDLPVGGSGDDREVGAGAGAGVGAGIDPGVDPDGEPGTGRVAAAAQEPAAGPGDPAGASGLRVVAHRTPLEEPELSIEPDLLTELELDQPDTRVAARQARSTRGHQPPPAPQDQPVVRAQPTATAGGRARRRRSAVPSWDEIVFGSKREDG